jgi:hypothetical protein
MFEPRPKLFRRKRVHEGETWTHELTTTAKLEKAQRDKGLLCRECKRRVPWKDLTAKYDTFGDNFIRVWFCNKCGNMVKEEEIGGQSVGVPESLEGPTDRDRTEDVVGQERAGDSDVEVPSEGP